MASFAERSLATQTLSSICDSALKNAAKRSGSSILQQDTKRYAKQTFQTSVVSETEGKISSMTKEEAEKIIKVEVGAILAPGEPMNLVLDPAVINSLMVRHLQAILKFLPSDDQTIFK